MSVATNAGWMDTTLILPFSASAMDSLNLRRQQSTVYWEVMSPHPVTRWTC